MNSSTKWNQYFVFATNKCTLCKNNESDPTVYMDIEHYFTLYLPPSLFATSAITQGFW